MGGGSTNGTSSSSAAPTGEYTNAKTSVLWDIENCHVPRGCDPNAIAQNISAALENMNYRGQIIITAYGDTSKIPQSVQHALSSTGITLNHVPAGVKDASDKRILVDMMLWAIDNPAPANYLLISGDRDFSNALHQLRLRRYNILLAQPQNVSAPLVAAAKTVWLWTSLVAGGAALSNGDSLQSNNNNNNNNTTQEDPGPVGHAFETNNLTNHRSYGNGRTDVKSKTKQPWRSPTQPNLSRSSNNLRQPPFGTQEGTTTGGSDKFNQKMNLSAPQQNQIPTSKPHSTESQDFNVPNFTGASASVFHQPLMNTTDSNSRPPSSSSSFSHQSGYAQGKQFNEAPHNFFADNMSSVSSGPNPNFGPSHPDLTRNNVNHFASNYTNQYCPPPLKPSDLTQQPAFTPGNLFLPNSHVHNPHIPPPKPDGPAFTSGPPTNIPDISKLLISEHPNLVHSTSSFQSNGAPGMSAVSEPSHHHKFSEPQYSHPPQGTLPFYPNPSNIGNYPRGPEYRPPTAPALDKTNNPSSGLRGPPGYPQASTHDLGLVGIVLLALDTLKADKIVPTEANIADCIHYGKLNQPNFDVKTALSRALDLQMVVMHSAGGALQIYVPKGKKLWKCVNPINCNIKNGKEKCEAVQKFITSVGGRATITASPSRYKAAEILKSRCLTDSTLGEVFQILHMIITVKKWIIPHPSGWQPLSISIPEDGANLAI